MTLHSPLRISIVTPVLNGADYLASCMRNVAEQEYDDVEHIIVDGGSTDGTLDIVKQFAESHHHVKLLSRPGMRQSAAMNLGISVATGTILGILNDDDYYEPGVLKRVGKLFANLPAPSFVSADCNIWLKAGELLRVDHPAHLGITNLLQGPPENPFPCNPSSYFYHRILHDRIGLYDEEEDYVMDLDFILRAVRAAHLVYVEETWGNFRFIPGTKTFDDIELGRCLPRVKACIQQCEQSLPLHFRALTITKRLLLKIHRAIKRLKIPYPLVSVRFDIRWVPFMNVWWLPPFVRKAQLPKCIRTSIRRFHIAKGSIIPSAILSMKGGRVHHEFSIKDDVQRLATNSDALLGTSEEECPMTILSETPICLVAMNIIGPWPPWMAFFYETCRYNSTVHWLLVGSEPLPPGMPQNIRYIPMDLRTFNHRASERLGLRVKVQPRFPQKLCDYKCVYGKIFEEYLTPYQFWGHCDLDVVFGNIRSFLTREILDECDVISSFGQRLNGPFTIYRNTPEILRVYEKNPIHRVVFTDARNHYCFDEYHLTQTLREIAAKGELRLRFDDALQRHNRHGGLHYWEEGCLWEACSRKQALLFHFAQWKKKWTHLAFSFDVQGPRAFVILREGLFQLQHDWSSSLEDDYAKAMADIQRGHFHSFHPQTYASCAS